MSKIREKLSVYKTPFIYTGSTVIKSLASILVSLVIAKYISPNELGLWSSISLVLIYSNFLQGGIINGLNLELPYAYGKGEIKKGNKLASVARTYIIFIAIISLFVGLLFFLIYPTSNDKVKWSILSISLIIPITFYQNYLLSTFRSNNSFLKLSYIQIIESILNIVTLAFIVYYAYYGMLVKSVLVILMYTLLLHLSRPIRVKHYWDKRVFMDLIKVGFPIFSLAYVESIASTIDKVWLIKFSDLTNLGLYSFGLYAITMVTLISSSIASYIYPRMTYNYGQNNNKIILWRMVKKITLILFIILMPIVIIGTFLIPYFIESFFPAYILSTKTMQVLLIAGLFKGCAIGVNVLWSMKKWKYMFFYQATYTLLLISITYLCFRILDFTIEGLALGVLIANIVNFLNAMVLSYKATHERVDYEIYKS